MKKVRVLVLSLIGMVMFAGAGGFVVSSQQATMQQQDKTRKIYKPVTQTKESQKAMTPAQALQMLKDGNERFVNGEFVNRDARAQIKATSEGQYPFATILSCQDSRTSNDLLFDLNNGDAFSLRIAGNIANDDILGGMEFGSKVAGAKLIAVVGHTKCGAVYGAADDVKLGNLTGLLGKIRPAAAEIPKSIEPRNSKNAKFVDALTEANVRYQMRMIREKSPILKEMIDKGEVGLVGGVYDISNGKVTFFNN